MNEEESIIILVMRRVTSTIFDGPLKRTHDPIPARDSHLHGKMHIWVLVVVVRGMLDHGAPPALLEQLQCFGYWFCLAIQMVELLQP